MQAGQVDPATTCRYFVYYDSGLTERMRLVDGSSTYEILGVREIGRKEGMELYAGTV